MGGLRDGENEDRDSGQKVARCPGVCGKKIENRGSQRPARRYIYISSLDPPE